MSVLILTGWCRPPAAQHKGARSFKPSLIRGLVPSRRLLSGSSRASWPWSGCVRWSERFRWDHVADAFADVARAVAGGAPLPEVPDFIGGTIAKAEQGGAPVPGSGALPGRLEVGG